MLMSIRQKISWNWTKVKNVQPHCVWYGCHKFHSWVNTCLSSVQHQDEKQISIYSLYCFSGGAEVVVLVAVEAVQEALQTLEDVKGLFWSYFAPLKKGPIKPRKKAYILVTLSQSMVVSIVTQIQMGNAVIQNKIASDFPIICQVR